MVVDLLLFTDRLNYHFFYNFYYYTIKDIHHQSYVLKVKLNNNISINFVGLIEYPSIRKMITDGLD
jgi:hypothetical protein